MEGEREKVRDGGREGGQQRERSREGGREGRKEGARDEWRKGGREGGHEGSTLRCGQDIAPHIVLHAAGFLRRSAGLLCSACVGRPSSCSPVGGMACIMVLYGERSL